VINKVYKKKKIYLGSRHASRAPVAAAAVAVTGAGPAAGAHRCCDGWSGVDMALLCLARERPTSHDDSLAKTRAGVVEMGCCVSKTGAVGRLGGKQVPVSPKHVLVWVLRGGKESC